MENASPSAPLAFSSGASTYRIGFAGEFWLAFCEGITFRDLTHSTHTSLATKTISLETLKAENAKEELLVTRNPDWDESWGSASIHPKPNAIGIIIAWSDMQGNVHGKTEGHESSLQWAGLAVVKWTNIPWETIKPKPSLPKPSLSGDSIEPVASTGTSCRGVWKVVNKASFNDEFASYQGPIFCVIDDEDRMLWTDNFELHYAFQNSILERNIIAHR